MLVNVSHNVAPDVEDMIICGMLNEKAGINITAKVCVVVLE